MTCREQVEAIGAKITVQGNQVTVWVPSRNVMAQDAWTCGPPDDAVEACCRAIVKHLEEHKP